MNHDPDRQVVLVRCGHRTCALAVEDVVETLRPAPVSPLVGTPPFVTGAAVIRGEPVPVVDLAALLGDPVPPRPGRFVVLRCGGRRAALAVEAVVGVSVLRDAAGVAPLLEAAAGGAIEALSASDRELLVVLRAARVVPDAAWRALDPAASERRS